MRMHSWLRAPVFCIDAGIRISNRIKTEIDPTCSKMDPFEVHYLSGAYSELNQSLTYISWVRANSHCRHRDDVLCVNSTRCRLGNRFGGKKQGGLVPMVVEIVPNPAASKAAWTALRFRTFSWLRLPFREKQESLSYR